jgi:hypothetical protein
MMMTVVTMMNGSIRRNGHSSKNDECNHTQKYITHLHVKLSPLSDRSCGPNDHRFTADTLS